MDVMACSCCQEAARLGSRQSVSCLEVFLGMFPTTKFRSPCRNINDAPALLTGLLLRFSRLVKVISNNNHAINSEFGVTNYLLRFRLFAEAPGGRNLCEQVS